MISPRTRAAWPRGADLPADVTSSVTKPIDVLLNLAPITMEQFTALTALTRAGGVVVNTTV